MLQGRFLKDESNDLHYNLALEHALLLLHPMQGYFPTLRLWRNPRSVILGRGQLIDREVDLVYCSKHGIEVGRRISGGGAVYQDEGNLNISILALKKAMRNYDGIRGIGAHLTDLLVKSIKDAGFDEIERQGYYNILNDGRKISGAASYFSRDSILHHATLLIDASLEHLEGSLFHRTDDPNYRHCSRYCPTTNLVGLDVDVWEKTLISLLRKEFGVDLKRDTITDEERDLAAELRDLMYSRQSWIVDGKATSSATQRFAHRI